MKRFWLWVPFALFALFFGVFINGLANPTSHDITSKMIGKSIPGFSLPPATLGVQGLGSVNLVGGEPRLVNIFASWCIPCIAEAPILLQLKQQGVSIEGIAIRDKPDNVARFLARNGNPYERIGSDVNSSVQMELGSSGVPETFVVDARGVIRHQHIGDIRPEDVPGIVAALRSAR
jgi:cytochrome c biogenesis protein CcmG, thiol:disulfide interchange protein DsbE